MGKVLCKTLKLKLKAEIDFGYGNILIFYEKALKIVIHWVFLIFTTWEKGGEIK